MKESLWKNVHDEANAIKHDLNKQRQNLKKLKRQEANFITGLKIQVEEDYFKFKTSIFAEGNLSDDDTKPNT